MAINIEKTKRIFKIQKNGKTVQLSDPNPEMSITEVADSYSGKYPELLNATHEQTQENGDLIITFKTVAGTKG